MSLLELTEAKCETLSLIDNSTAVIGDMALLDMRFSSQHQPSAVYSKWPFIPHLHQFYSVDLIPYHTCPKPLICDSKQLLNE